ncbi:MAG: hypothetical protein R2682_08730 [Pyrinomonadaceae bacterium]
MQQNKEQASPLSFCIDPKRFDLLRSNDDFLAFIRVGRLLNAVAFSTEVLLTSRPDGNDPRGTRQYNRAFFLTGGYLYEAVQLIDSLYLEFQHESYFAGLKQFATSNLDKGFKKVLQTMRHSIAFHLDCDNKSTQQTLPNLSLSSYRVMSATTETYRDFYFDLADTVDINYLVDSLGGPDSETIVLNRIAKSVSEMQIGLLSAGHDFLLGLAKKLNLADKVL